MTHTIEVNHAKDKGKRRSVERSPTGRISREYVAANSGEYDRLRRELAQEIRGEVRFDAGSRALYATDASNYRQVPIGVVIPRSVEDAVKTMRLCHDHRDLIRARYPRIPRRVSGYENLDELLPEKGF
jgi:hypothetical protein